MCMWYARYITVCDKNGTLREKSSELETLNNLIYIIITSRLSKQNHLSRANDHPKRDYIHCLFKETFRRVFTIMSNPRVCCMIVYSSTRLYRLVTD